MKVSRSKTEYLCINKAENLPPITITGEDVREVTEFKYLGSTVQSDGGSDKEVRKRIQAGWNSW